MATFLDNFPVKFSSDHDDCLDYDERVFCQLAQQDDPLHFTFQSAVIGDELIYCPNFDLECCTDPGGGEESECEENDQYWQSESSGFYAGGWAIGDGLACNDDGGDLFQENVLSSIGTYRAIVTIAGYPNNISNTGSFRVQIGNVLSDSITAVAGTYTVYLNVTDISSFDGVKIIASDESVFCISSISVKQICTEYLLTIRDLEDNIMTSFEVGDPPEGGLFFHTNGFIYAVLDWRMLGLEDGCYKICITELCGNTGNLYTGNFTEWTATQGSLEDFTFGVEEDSICHLEASTVINYDISGLTVGCEYFVTMDIDNETESEIMIVLIDGDNIGTSSGSVVDGVFSSSFIATDSIATITLTLSDTFIGCISNLSVTVNPECLDYACSECYNLRETHPCTKILIWYNTDNAFGIDYFSGFRVRHHMRVKAVLKSASYKQEQDEHIDSGGTGQILYFNSRKAKELFIDDIPEYMHDAIAIGKGHDFFKIGNDFLDAEWYICEAGYEPEWDEYPLLKTAKSRFLVYKITQDNKNRLC